MKQQFTDKNFRAATLATIAQANIILEEYARQGLVLTLRQLYYQFVARGYLANKQTEYKRLGATISDARLAGLVDWDMMEDRTRFVRRSPSWTSPASIVSAVAAQYQEDLWRNQPYRPEVWIEKDALVGVIERVCRELRVDHFACRGYASQSAQYTAGRRFRRMLQNGQRPVVLHLGDHDPSGIDMTRDNSERVAMFAEAGVQVIRLALNMDQVEEYDPPPNPAKETDSRSVGYIAEYGDQSWELDALEPTVINDLIRENVLRFRDEDAWELDAADERINQRLLAAVSSRWDEVRGLVQ